ncbi:MAG TPA: DUF4115 domain-containing protein, partial [Vicinamibacterales bacterium]|nr:DUF4115 domain-containing protein [Vicinamibacterales bacterium]
AAGAAAAVILTIVASRGDSPAPPDIQAAGLHRASTTAQPPPAPAPPESAEQNPSPAPAPAAEADLPIPDGAMRVKIEAVRPCWIHLTANGRSEERVLQAGEALIRDSQTDVVLRAGNAGALVVTINGGTIPPLGREGEIVTRRLPHAPATAER